MAAAMKRGNVTTLKTVPQVRQLIQRLTGIAAIATQNGPAASRRIMVLVGAQLKVPLR